MADDEPAPHQPRGSRWPIALSAGVAVGAVGVAAYAYAIRIPTGGRSADTTSEPSALLLTSLVLTVVAAVATLAVGWWALTGKDARPYAATLLAGTVIVTGYRYLGEGAARATAALSGPGARPAVPLAQLAWPLLVVAALVLLAGTVWSPAARSPWRAAAAYLSPLTVLGVVVAVGVGGVAARAWEHQQPQPTIVAATPIPPLPTAVGTDVAYTVTAENAFNVLPAGPGFVVWDGGGIQAYDGVTGATRWRFGREVLPQDCALRDVLSTGTTEQSVVIAECVRPKPYAGRYDHADRSILTGIDATTGAVRWLDDDNLYLGYGAGQSDSQVVVNRGTEIGVIDPRTGALRWMTSGAETPCEKRGDLVAGHVVIVPCGQGAAVRVLDGDSGAEHQIDLRPYLPKGGLPDLDTLAADGDTLLIRAQPARPYGGRETDLGTLAIDVSSGTVVAVPSVTGRIQRGPSPGPLVQLGAAVRDDSYVDVYRVAASDLVRVTGVGSPDTYAGTGRLWARVGEDMVTAAANDDVGRFLAMVGSDGAVRRQELPCPGRHTRFDSGAGVLSVPGATLVLCPPPPDRVKGWAIVGLR